MNEVYERTVIDSPLRRYMIENYLHTYMNKFLDEETAKKGMISRMNMKHGPAFLLDLFETMRQRKGKWRDPSLGTGCEFHIHDDGRGCRS